MSLEKKLFQNCSGTPNPLYSQPPHVIAEWKKVTQSGIKAAEDRRIEQDKKIAESRKYEKL